MRNLSEERILLVKNGYFGLKLIETFETEKELFYYQKHKMRFIDIIDSFVIRGNSLYDILEDINSKKKQKNIKEKR